MLDRALPPETLRRLIDEVTIRETFFFRHRSELDAIEWFSVLDAARARGSGVVRVWVAGCASGEEAYTVAILACEAFASAAPPVRVLEPTSLPPRSSRRPRVATASAPYATCREEFVTALLKRTRGGLRQRAAACTRGAPPAQPRARPDPPAGEQPFDVILCRNVLIYFDRPTVEQVVRALEGALAPAGLLVLGAADRLSGQSLPVSRIRPGVLGPPSSRTQAPGRRALVRPSRQTRAGADAQRSTPLVGQPTQAQQFPSRRRPTP